MQDKKAALNQSAPSKTNWTRTAPYDFTGCLAHADITFNQDTGHVSRIVGILQHNNACAEAAMKRLPAIPLHRHVIEIALRQLKDGASITAIQQQNIDMFTARAYRDQATTDPLRANYRFQLLSSDFRALYRAHHRSHSIDIRKTPEKNIHSWLDPQSSGYRADFRRSVYQYVPRTATNDRFKLCICTPEMEQAAWTYVHGGQLILDGTFGLCSSRILVWIAMGINADRKGVPVAFMMFSAPSGSKATHAGYNTAVITELLQDWKDWLEGRPLANGRLFIPLSAITDTDPKERGALIIVWTAILLLLCLFHVRQCWKNKRHALIETVAGEVTTYWKMRSAYRIGILEASLLATTSHNDALQLITSERTAFTATLLTRNPDSARICEGVLKYLDYLEATWMPLPIWRSWSAFGRAAAAEVLGVPINQVLTTTNHLESFNGKLKHKEIASAQHSKRRLRIDVLCNHLVTVVLPRLFARLRLASHLSQWMQERFPLGSDGTPLAPARRRLVSTTSATPVAWFPPNDLRDVRAIDAVQTERLTIINNLRPFEVWATCVASAADRSDPEHARYWLTLHPTGSATCTCPDWMTRGQACKHLRALVIHVKFRLGPSMYALPTTLEEAEAVYNKNTAWYGERYGQDITAALCPRTFPQGYHLAQFPPNMQVCEGTDAVTDVAPLPLPDIESPLPTDTLATEADLAALADDDQDEGEPPDTIAGGVAPDTPSWQDSDPAPPPPLNAELNAAAVATQIQQKFDHEVTVLLPRLHGIATLLGDGPSLRATQSSQDFGGVLRDILAALPAADASNSSVVPRTQALAADGTAMQPGDVDEPAAPRSQPKRKLAGAATCESKSQEVLPLSPERKASKRIKSYGTL
ncbi:hypothetical protein FA95DRAFT_1607832 [Auriscalpium vulgare]|uniref:Uncharacterized protein n=1 Tax=Auriscalpium vulgare TaxID=40419 RepID=A0ACB8RMR7_9AGAM|nr:hypothetical protein FA95DRAFT_1607832 [Auriscalpium vulgare]